MSAVLLPVLGYALIAAVAMATGGIVAAWKPPTPGLRSGIQHFAAGVVFAAVSMEVLPDVMHRREPVAAALGFTAGVLLMLAIRWLTRKLEGGNENDESAGGNPWSLAIAVGIDVLIDGLLIGVSVSAAGSKGALVALAIAVELLSLGLAVSASFCRSDFSRPRAILATSILALLPLIGASLGVLFLSGWSGAAMEAILACACAALLYLVTEELLVEAHEVPETPLRTAAFFAGFLALMILEMLSE